MVKRSTITSTLAGILISTASNIYAQNRQIEFEKDTIWENTLEKAKKEDKLIFLDAYTDWCIPCKKMEKSIFTNDSVADFYNANFINARINAEKGYGKELKKVYSINAYPTLIFVDHEGKMAHRKIGGLNSKEFITLGKEAMNLEERLSRFNERYEQGERDSKFILEYLKKLKDTGINYDKVIDEYFQTQKEENLISRINWEIICLDNRKDRIDSKEFKFLLENKEKFDAISTTDSVDLEIFDSYLWAGMPLIYGKVDETSYETWKNKVKNSGFYRSREVLLEVSLRHNELKKNWNEFIQEGVELLDSFKRADSDPSRLNRIAYAIYNHKKEDKILLQKALECSERSVELKRDEAGYLLHGILLYTLGRTDEAIKAEETALELSMETKNDYLISKIEKNLQKMKKGESLK